MLKESSLFIVESPLQVICAIEAINYYQCNTVTILVRKSVKRVENNRHIDAVLERLKYFHPNIDIEIISWTVHVDIRHVIDDYLSFNLFRKKHLNLHQTVFIGDFRIPWMRTYAFCINAKKFILLDDGMATLEVRNNIIDKHDFYYRERFKKSNLKGLLKTINRMAYDLFQKRPKDFSCFSYFSSFITNPENIKIDKNSYAFLHASTKYKQTTSSCYYFGSPLSERGVISSIDNELLFLKKVAGFFIEKKFQWNYIPHRDDSIQKLESIRGIGIHVMPLEMPAELHFLESEETPAILAAAQSSVLITAQLLLPQARIVSFRVPSDIVSVQYSGSMDDVYSFISSRNIPIERI